ncbi:MAG TPA: metallophosphoesterase [Anaerolineae bacterium]|nr:metallophosphoesterase [Anaerolineae bacterium]HMR63653.1 metallophosphoesterase [Anaerolineae bacterium]
MKILCVSDKVVEYLYSPSITQKFCDIDLVIGCGDLPYYYLEYIQSLLNVSLIYVHGNHDPEKEYLSDGSVVTGPLGGVNLHCQTYRSRQILLAGLEGSIRYRQGYFQYSQREMWFNTIVYLAPQLLINKILYGRYLDILVAHSPPYGIHNGEDRVHQGFKAFLWLMRTFKPRYLVHGHRHVYNPTEIVETQYGATKVINIYPYRLLEIEAAQ